MHDSVSSYFATSYMPLIDVFIHNKASNWAGRSKSRAIVLFFSAMHNTSLRCCREGILRDFRSGNLTYNWMIPTIRGDGIGLLKINEVLTMRATMERKKKKRKKKRILEKWIQGYEAERARERGREGGCSPSWDFDARPHCRLLRIEPLQFWSISLSSSPLDRFGMHRCSQVRSAHEKWQLRQKRIVYPCPQPRFRIIDTYTRTYIDTHTQRGNIHHEHVCTR